MTLLSLLHKGISSKAAQVTCYFRRWFVNVTFAGLSCFFIAMTLGFFFYSLTCYWWLPLGMEWSDNCSKFLLTSILYGWWIYLHKLFSPMARWWIYLHHWEVLVYSHLWTPLGHVGMRSLFLWQGTLKCLSLDCQIILLISKSWESVEVYSVRLSSCVMRIIIYLLW